MPFIWKPYRFNLWSIKNKKHSANENYKSNLTPRRTKQYSTIVSILRPQELKQSESVSTATSKKEKTHFKADVCGSECNSGFLLNHHLPLSLIHEAATADYLLIGQSLLTVTVAHPRCSACFTVFNGRLAEHNSASGCSDHLQSMSWVLGDAAGRCCQMMLEEVSAKLLRRRRVGQCVSVRHGCPLLVDFHLSS